MAIKLEFAALADNAHIDASGKMFVLGVFDTFTVKAVPTRHASFWLAMRWSGDRGDVRERPFALTIAPLDDKGAPVFRQSLPPAEFRFRASPHEIQDRCYAQILVSMQGMPLPRFGRFKMSVSVDGRVMGEIPFYVLPRQSAPSVPHVTD